ncbi:MULTISPECIES: strawberry notch family protein [unclassified Novosphingobium]|uniref:strawberry notch family protein n=1 Tax=unclassified Novosphingobium TaxID=2644732 RepID=UPI001494128D|nr:MULTISPECIES: strawberry notch family protein [unclassified Novosphingobium]MBB3357035.1 putative RNA methylase [Novosphingobium sp. BK256]MBB3373436.1 putative RNA methylase [Novosphingobium sp. BK280]MBB3377805.1 putative RNA methylase [Novosphingobium sp. BK258]MBB3418784.1 putative RNA methylase [Novosphingobium sp. BK267]MBB3450381.1 putative RNA methylase [Novosphingobium sp. BK352]
MSQPLLALVPPHEPETTKAAHLFAVATRLAEMLGRCQSVRRQDLTRLMEEAFGASDASGAWSMRDAYDALEAAQVLLLTSTLSPSVFTLADDDAFASLVRFERALPTQTYRSEHQVEMQQFSTPISLAWLAARAARIRGDDHVLEPSAGTGMLAAHALRADAAATLNERDPDRAALLGKLLGQPVTLHDAEFIHDLLPSGVAPTVVLMNPPFSRSEGRGKDRFAGARHLRSALLRLAPGGRCVAIMPPSFAADGTAASGYAMVCETVQPRAEITILGHPYAKHGTSIPVRLLIFDKGWTGVTERHTAQTIEAAEAIVRAFPVRLAELDPQPPAPAAVPLRPRKPGSATATIFGGIAKRVLTRPDRIAADTSPRPLVYTVRETPLSAGDPVGHYAPWRPARIAIEGAKAHPDQLVESVAMASVLPPAPSYRPMLQPQALAALSEAQLETIIYAGEACERDLNGTFAPNQAGDQLREDPEGASYRTGFFIADGTGVGKGREGAGIILDQWNRGRRRAICISRSSALTEDARRDWSALGGLPIDIQPLDAFPLGEAIGMDSGILFLTYATLRSQRHDRASRLQQLLDWAGTDFEGVILLDESHALGNAAGTETEFGVAKGSEQGLAGVRLQNALPRARVIYVSATGATKPENLSYTARLGLWGPGTAFQDRDAFLAAMEEGGIAAMEIVARDTKAMGLYTARALSFAGVEYDPLEHKLTPDQITIYDAYADAWAVIHAGVAAALEAANIVDRASGRTLNAMAKGSALSRFESSKQRFWSALLISMKMPTVFQAIETEIAAGNVAVVQLVSTSEAILDRRLAELSPEERAHLDLELSPRATMIDYLKSAFPTQQMRVFATTDGSLRSEPMRDEAGNMVQCAEAIARRDALIEELCAMPPVPAALDALIAHFGTAKVAEVTGRSRRIVIGTDGCQKLERRGARANLAETQAFMNGQKPILVFSDAGGTGRSYHADLGCRTADKRRIHFLLEPGWRADVAIQGLGRTHRTNQSVPPVFRPVTTDCKGERRFISTIARRLDSLGALTRGQRQTGGQNMFDPADNLESDYAREALTQWYHLLHGKKLASVTLADFEGMTGLKLTDDDGTLLDKLPPIQRWLNRILALRIAAQNAIFDEYMGLIQARVDAAREAGTLDVGVETIRAEQVIVRSEQTLRTDPVTGAETRLLRLELHLRPRVMHWKRLMQIWEGTSEIAYLYNSRSKRVALKVPSWSITDEEGRIISMCQLVRPTGATRMQEIAMWASLWKDIDRDEFQRLWEAEASEAEAKVEIETVNVATGLLLPVWHRLPQDDVRVWRIDDREGTSILGRLIPPEAMADLQSAFGLDGTVELTAAELSAAAQKGTGIAIPGLGGATLTTALVNGTRRLEIRNYRPDDRERLKARGVFSEVIQYKTRLFVPLDRSTEVIETILAMTRI